MRPARLLILGGTGEASGLAAAAAARFAGRLEVTLSLAGRLAERPPPPGYRVRRGGFGGTEGLVRHLAAAAVDLVIDATHPFAATISAHAAAACAAAAVPRLLLLRPPWVPAADDRWIEVADADEAAARLPALGRRVFLTTGPGSFAAFAAVPDVWFLVRLFEPPPSPLPLPRHRAVIARPPFTVDDETALIRDHAIETVVSKQAGGATRAKLQAAARLGLPVVMIRRPDKPAGARVADVEGALAWLAARLTELSRSAGV
ncbi:MAG: cobalt-precorrin-6A reductase [Rhodospirillales bacterium]